MCYPGLPSHPGHEIAKRQMKRGFSGIMSFKIKGSYDNCVKFVEVHPFRCARMQCLCVYVCVCVRVRTSE